MAQRVQVRFDGHGRSYTYSWPGEMPLAKNDRVVVPPSWANPDYHFATVVGTEEGYDGPVKDITGLVDRETGHVYYPVGEPEE